jgi:RNA polymerase sigma factor (sigma-70 family)
MFVFNYRPLTKEEEIDLWNKFKDGCIDSRNKLVESIIPLVVSKTDCDDETQFVLMAVMDQITRNFDPAKGRLTTFAYRPISWAKCKFRNKNRLIPIPPQPRPENAISQNIVTNDCFILVDEPYQETTEDWSKEYAKIEEHLSSLTEREEQVIRYMLRGWNQPRIAEKFKLSCQRISQLYLSATRKLSKLCNR